ncbi:putative elongator complex protein 1 [Massospora cicadina]|nr:putative elongator complex protein 1 [Massospora cicadina]
MKSLTLLHQATVKVPGESRRSLRLSFNATEGKVFVSSLVGDECQIMVKVGASKFETLISLPVPSCKGDLTIVSSKYVLESDALCLCFSNGDILSVPTQAPESLELIGSVGSGLRSVAWSPDEENFAAVTGEDKLLILTRGFDVISDQFVHVAERGEVSYANVGWGSKATQFHGSEGKRAAQAKGPTELNLSPDDDLTPRVSWRGDGGYLVCSAVDPDTRLRVLRVYDREGALQSTSEPVDQLEHPLAWKPSGAIIASTQRLPHRHHAVFFERNGLRHGEFTLPTDIHKVLEMRWNGDSSLLALSVIKAVEGRNLPFLQLWHMNNYFWYLKYELQVASVDAVSLSEFVFDSESPLRLSLILSDGTYAAFEFGWFNLVSESTSSSTASLAAVVHGPTLLLTPFRYQNVPPPKSGFQLPADHPILHVAFSGFDGGNKTAALGADQRVRVFEFAAGDFSKPPARSLTLALAGPTGPPSVAYRQICFPAANVIYGLGYSPDHRQDVVTRFEFLPETGAIVNVNWLHLSEPCIRLVLKPFSTSPALQTFRGEVLLVHWAARLEASLLLTQPEGCPWLQLVATASEDKCRVVGLSRRNKLYIDGTLVDAYCTSFFIHNEYVVYSTGDHLARFIPLKGPTPEVENYTRTLERGSRIVLCVPHDVSLVLQMPRGNLETVYPRTLLFSAIRESLAKRDYRKAFILCRKYRIDMNVLFDLNPAQLLEDMGQFVDQVRDPDYLNLFISSLKEEDVLASKYPQMAKAPPGRVDTKVNSLCGAIRSVLQAMDPRLYSQPTVTTYARQLPPDLEAVLKLLKELRRDDPALAEETLKYAIFLADVDQLFDVALGLYDFELVLMVAQHSQKDPKEYVPFLSELQSLDDHYRRFKIDVHLQRFERALGHLAKAGRRASLRRASHPLDRFDECLAYICEHALYARGLGIFAGDAERFNIILERYGSYLMDLRQYSEAGSGGFAPFMHVRSYAQAIRAFKKVGEWQRALVCATRLGLSQEETLPLIDELCGYLKHHSRHLEAAKLLETYKEDPEEVVACLLEGHHWQDAIYSCERFSRPDLIETDVKSAVNSVADQMAEDIQDMREQFTKQRLRVHELQNAPPPEGPSFEALDLDDVDVLSDTTSAFTNFTVYTSCTQMTGPSAYGSAGSTKTGKSRRKMERKRNRGKKGSAFEYEYLLGSVGRLVERANGMHADLRHLLHALVTLGHLPAAQRLHAEFEALLRQLALHLDAIYAAPQPASNLEAMLSACMDPSLVTKPTLSTSTAWKLGFLASNYRCGRWLDPISPNGLPKP